MTRKNKGVVLDSTHSYGAVVCEDAKVRLKHQNLGKIIRRCERMSKPESLLICQLLLILGPQFLFTRADIGTAGTYSPPYTPTTCYDNDFSQFLTSNLFAAAREGIWDNGAACGRQYLVKCISGPLPQMCVSGQTIQIRIVDRASISISRPSIVGSSIVLSNAAFQIIADPVV